MTSPSLTVVVPTYNRPTLLPRALDCLMRQTVSVRVIVADDGDCDRTDGILKAYYIDRLRGGQIVHLRTGADNAWDNWRAGAEAVESELVAWAQDDDVTDTRYAERIVTAFADARSHGADPLVWMARLECSDATGTMAIPMAGSGPMVPMRSLFGDSEPAHYREGKAVAPAMYLSAWSLSPAIAYRNGPEFRAALAAMPPACDVFIERMLPATMARYGGFIADPAIIGLWVRHEDHLSTKQHPDQPRQTGVFHRYMDGLLDGLDGWEAHFRAWCGVIRPEVLLSWLGQLDHAEAEGGKSRHGEAIRRVVEESLEGRLKAVPPPPGWRPPLRDRLRAAWRRASAPLRRTPAATA